MSPVNYGPEVRVLGELYRPPAATCGHEQHGQRCGATDDIHPYLVGPRCPQHTPARLAGQPEPGRTATPNTARRPQHHPRADTTRKAAG
ncbi:MAG: hypothetical protein JWR88_1036 [Pseudonocardia sp.]|nr:hypothetical protein [Pseudonocardia sp.]